MILFFTSYISFIKDKYYFSIFTILIPSLLDSVLISFLGETPVSVKNSLN